ncbi:uncharacterized protein LOC129779697 [Toxorhynchites rutilus septentrionalis]|uniref:uncharacterized protein LOC129779697 n=1 Tax=Toxorhynchites rutilus septentrionalis TaxID=329112 RepID=UPI00247AC97B|nr:uncharacterized protein LOC129779697 [Toxorhynchites rutilus septentrionalis]
MVSFLGLSFLLALLPPTFWIGSVAGADANQTDSTARCWSCVSKYKTWTDCQNVAESEPCNGTSVDPEAVSCLKSTIRVQRMNGDSRFHRIAGCAMNLSALQQQYLDNFELTFNQTGDINVTLVELVTCQGELCNVMDETALRMGPIKVVHLNVMNVSGAINRTPFIGLILTIVGILSIT